ncbi:hypothetical protein Trydic_g2256 [Trypoxylus dichotomus]
MTSRDVKIDPIKVPDVECIIQEVSDRQRRKNNIILYNVSENVLNNRNDQVAADMELVGEQLQMLDVSVDNLRTIRLGKFDSSRTDMKRPIKYEDNESQGRTEYTGELTKYLAGNSYIQRILMVIKAGVVCIQIHYIYHNLTTIGNFKQDFNSTHGKII